MMHGKTALKYLNVIWSELCEVLTSDKDLYVWERLEHQNCVHKEFQMKLILDNACNHGVQHCFSYTRKGKGISSVYT